MCHLQTASLLLLLAFSCGTASTLRRLPHRPTLDGRIVGGQAIDISDAPHQVSLQRGYHFCGGSLIAKRVVLTAAHCTAGATAASIQVRIGSTLSAQGGKLVSVQEIHGHEKYNPTTIDYDFSVLLLEDYDDNELISGIIALPKADAPVADGAPLTVSGWGNTQNDTESNKSLRAVTVPKVSQKKCTESYAGFGGITDRMICAGLPVGGKDACQGDSGGPLVGDGILVGVVSWGYGCAKPQYPGVYSRVASVRAWITEKSGV